MPTRHENEPYTGLQQAVMQACGQSKGYTMMEITANMNEKTADNQPGGGVEIPAYRLCVNEHEALLIANHSLRYLANQLNSMVCTLLIVKSEMEKSDETAYYGYALEPIVRWLEELANDECKPCEYA